MMNCHLSICWYRVFLFGLPGAALLLLTGCNTTQPASFNSEVVMHQAEVANMKQRAAQGVVTETDPLADKIHAVSADIDHDWTATKDLKAGWDFFLYPGSPAKVPDDIIQLAVQAHQAIQTDDVYLAATRIYQTNVYDRCQALAAECDFLQKTTGDPLQVVTNPAPPASAAGLDALHENIQRARQETEMLGRRLDDYLSVTETNRLSDAKRAEAIAVGDKICSEKDYLKALKTYRSAAEKHYAAVQAECQVYAFWRESVAPKNGNSGVE